LTDLYKIYTKWTFERVLRHVIYWMAWLVFFSSVKAILFEDSFARWAILESFFIIPKCFVTYCTIYWLIPEFFLKQKRAQFFLYFGLILCIGGVVMWTIEVPYCHDSNFLENFLSINILLKFADLIYVAAIPTAIKLAQESFRQQRLAEKIKEQALNAELQLLKNQLHPHFLFNTLNNLYSLVLYNDEAAPDVVLRLSDLLSYMLYDCNIEKINLKKEVELISNYIELEKIRFNNRLSLETDFDEHIEKYKIAPLMLLPFVENAFKHGIASNNQAAWVKISLQIDHGQLYYQVENSLPDTNEKDKRSPLNSGIGLSNIRKRLDMLYPDHELNIWHNGTYKATLRIPLKLAQKTKTIYEVSDYIIILRLLSLQHTENMQ